MSTKTVLKRFAKLACCAFSLSAASADTLHYEWDGAGEDCKLVNGDNWNLCEKVGDNWVRTGTHGLPVLDDEVESYGDFMYLDADEAFNVKSFYFGRNGSPTTVVVSNGVLSVANFITIGQYGANAEMDVFGGSVTSKTVTVGNWESRNNNRLNVYGGTMVVSGADWPGSIVIGKQSHARGDMLIDGGTVIANNAGQYNSAVTIGFSNLGTPSAANRSSLTVASGSLSTDNVIDVGGSDSDGHGGGLLAVSGGTVDTSANLNIGCSSNGWGVVEMTGGRVTIGGETRIGNNPDVACAELVVNGGVFTSMKKISIGCNGWQWAHCSTGRLTVGGTGVVTDGTSDTDYMCFGGPNGVIRLNNGGSLITRAILRDNNADGTIEFNGGALVKSGDHLWQGGGLVDQNYVIKILEGGLVMDTTGGYWKVEGTVEGKIGDGGITKRGSETLRFAPNAADGRTCSFTGPIYVEEGTLEFSSNVDFPEFVDIIRVAEGATLTLPSAVTCRILDNKGTINGTVTVEADSETKVVTKAVWTGAAEDGDLFNNKNYIAYDQNGRVMYEQTITAATPIEVAYTDGVPSFAGFENVTRVIADDLLSEGYAVPAVVKTAVAWYDPSDNATLTLDEAGKVTGIANKGTAGAALNANAQFSDNCAMADGAFTSGGRQALKFVNNRGYVSVEPISITSGQDRTLFTVTERKPDLTEEDCQQMFPVELQAGGDWDGVGAFALSQWPWYNAHLRTYYYDSEKVNDDQSIGGTREEKVEFGGGNSADTTYILCGYATNMWIGGWSCGADGTVKPGTDIESHLSQLDQNNNEKSLKVILGQRLENPAPSEGLLGETLVFTNALTTAETEAVRLYLMAKWFDPKNPMPAFDSLVVNAQVDLGGATRTFEKLSGSGSFVDGTVVLSGDLVVTVNPDQSVVAPTFDRLVLGPNARLVVKGAKNLPTKIALNVVAFNEISGEFSACVGDNNVKVKVRYLDDYICARRDSGFAISVR